VSIIIKLSTFIACTDQTIINNISFSMGWFELISLAILSTNFPTLLFLLIFLALVSSLNRTPPLCFHWRKVLIVTYVQHHMLVLLGIVAWKTKKNSTHTQ
jgi:hypothetical protein